ncbi:MAG: molybdopterin-dependent oxidoreductase [Proteobacteria bacterium]|nr:molybdopterin-dependent oxidoreductase [Pseudomonadota bacterium]
MKRPRADAGLIIAVSITPSGYRLLSTKDVEAGSSEIPRPNVWLHVSPNGTVKVYVAKSEMGQGVLTALPMIVADELEADWKQVRAEMAPAGEEYKDPVWREQTTGGSTSVRHMFWPLRKAGAAARELLVLSAAREWDVPVAECQASHGKVSHQETGRSLTYGQLSEKAARLSASQNPHVKEEGELKLMGTSIRRLDVPDKVRGLADFGVDVSVPDMLYAAKTRPPAFGAQVISYDREAAERVKGVRLVVDLGGPVAVCADTPEAAWRGRDALQTLWSEGDQPDMANATLEKAFAGHLDKPGVSARRRGDVKDALERAEKRIEATYTLPYLAHAPIEPMNCTAHVHEDRCDIWAPTQNQSAIISLAAKVTGLKPEQISVHTMALGGGFGRRLEVDFVEEAVELSKVTGQPIKLVWTREEDMQNDFYRPGSCCRIQGGLDKKGRLNAWSHKVVVPSIWARVAPAMIREGVDSAAIEGIVDQKYDIPNFHVEYVRIDTPVPVGFWRSVGHSQNAFTMESFIDELAHAAQKDPLAFRLDLLKDQVSARRVLEVVAEKSGWGAPLKRGNARGVALHVSFGSHVAQVAEVSVDWKDGTIKVLRVVCAVDCGPVVNPDIVKSQMEGGIVFGLSASLKEKVDFDKGGVVSANFHDYPLLSIRESPDIEVYAVRSQEKIGGIGEPGVPPIAPAVANAVFAATGLRLRHLPMTPKTVLEGLGEMNKKIRST